MAAAIAATLLLLRIAGAQPAQAKLMAWRELSLPAGGRVLVAATDSPGQVTIGLAFPAGIAQSPQAPSVAGLAPWLFLREAWGQEAGALGGDSVLARQGWQADVRVDLDGTSIVMGGPATGTGAVLGALLDRLTAPARAGAAELAGARAAWAASAPRRPDNPELALRAELAGRHFGAHPYRVTPAALDAAAPPPEAAALRAWLDGYCQAGAMLLLVAGDLDADAFIADWQGRLDALPGQAPPPLRHPEAALGQPGSLIEQAGQAGLMLIQFPGVPGDSREAAPLAVAAGVLQQLMATDLVGARLAGSASAWFDFTSPGPRPLEIQIRRFAAADSARIEALVARLLERLRDGEFSEYQVITAKDVLFEGIDAATERGAGPPGTDAVALRAWSREALRQNLHFRRWRADMVSRLMGTGKSRVQEIARNRLRMERASFGLQTPE